MAAVGKLCRSVVEKEPIVALSDSCSEFLEAFREAAKELAGQVHWYSAPDHPLGYGEEIDVLRRACRRVTEEGQPFDVEAGANLLRLAASVMRYHDTPPGLPEGSKRQEEMTALIRLLQDNLGGKDASDAPSVVQDLVRGEPSAEQAAHAASRFKGMLSKLGKSAYDTAIKIAGDIASAAVKKGLDL